MHVLYAPTEIIFSEVVFIATLIKFFLPPKLISLMGWRDALDPRDKCKNSTTGLKVHIKYNMLLSRSKSKYLNYFPIE